MKDLMEKLGHPEWIRFIKFAMVGVVNTAFSFLIYVILVKMGLYYILASVLGYIAGIGVSYILNTLFVFREKRTSENLMKFVSVYATALVINLILLYLMVDVMGLSKILGQLAVTALVLFYNYFLQKIWTFKK